MDPLEISRRIRAYFGTAAATPGHRYLSWEHCYRFFRQPREDVRSAADAAALHLGFYLASWGMYRGSSFLLQRDYTVHKPTVEALLDRRFSDLWEREIGADARDAEFAQLILEAAAAVRESYRPHGTATDTLVTKVLLGTLACIPACDRFFKDGLRYSGIPYSYVNAPLVGRMVAFCTEHRTAIREEQTRIRSESGAYYPVMKLADMYFWQTGFEAAGEPADAMD